MAAVGNYELVSSHFGPVTAPPSGGVGTETYEIEAPSGKVFFSGNWIVTTGSGGVSGYPIDNGTKWHFKVNTASSIEGDFYLPCAEMATA